MSSKISDCLLKAFSAACSFTLCIDSFTMPQVFQEHLVSFWTKNLQGDNKNKKLLFVSFSKMFLQDAKKVALYFPMQDASCKSCERTDIIVYKKPVDRCCETLVPIHLN